MPARKGLHTSARFLGRSVSVCFIVEVQLCVPQQNCSPIRLNVSKNSFIDCEEPLTLASPAHDEVAMAMMLSMCDVSEMVLAVHLLPGTGVVCGPGVSDWLHPLVNLVLLSRQRTKRLALTSGVCASVFMLHVCLRRALALSCRSACEDAVAVGSQTLKGDASWKMYITCK